jgi:hypothetical protein
MLQNADDDPVARAAAEQPDIFEDNGHLLAGAATTTCRFSPLVKPARSLLHNHQTEETRSALLLTGMLLSFPERRGLDESLDAPTKDWVRPPSLGGGTFGTAPRYPPQATGRGTELEGSRPVRKEETQ